MISGKISLPSTTPLGEKCDRPQMWVQQISVSSMSLAGILLNLSIILDIPKLVVDARSEGSLVVPEVYINTPNPSGTRRRMM